MDIREAKASANENLGCTICKTLNARGFNAIYVKDGDEARRKAVELIGDSSSVGIPGSVTIREIGLIDALREHGTKVYMHWDPELKPEDKNQRLLDELTSDWFVTSANAFSLEDCSFVSIDGVGNRAGAMCWAPGKLLIIMGVNKITPDLSSAIKRVRDMATPPNSLRLGGGSACASAGRCVRCEGPERLCRVVAILERPQMGREVHVIIAGESLGY